MGKVSMVLLLVGLEVIALSLAWKNSYDNPLLFMCPRNKVLNYVSSVHHNGYEDRMWDLSCRHEVGHKSCYWTGYVNAFRDLITFQCHSGAFINGMHSYHRNQPEDRRWKFYCCTKRNYHTAHCHYTGWKNRYDGLMKLNTGRHYYIRGVISRYSGPHRDRQFRYQLCRLRKN